MLSIKKQQGAVLVVSMLLLLVMTVLALSASQATRTQERMAGNARDRDLASQSAEAGLRAGERRIRNTFTTAPNMCRDGRCEVFETARLDSMDATPLIYRDQAWWNQHARTYDNTTAATIEGSSLALQPPQFLIEELEEVPDTLTVPPTGPPPSRVFYRVTSRAVGGTTTSEVVLQSTYSRRFN